MWLRAKGSTDGAHHSAITEMTGKGIAGKQVREPKADYIEWVSLDDADGRKQGTRVNMIFKPKPTLK
jgi:hypothetical protein